MNIDELKDYLKSYKDKMLEIEALEHSLSGMRCAGSGDASSTSSKSTVQRYNAIIARIDMLYDQANDIATFIMDNFEGRDRVILYYMYIECMSVGEIAQILKLSASTISKSHHQALISYVHAIT